MVDVFLLKTLLKLLKMLPKLNICEKKEKQFWKTCYTKKSSVFCQRKKNKLLFSKRFVSNILCPKNKKNFTENFLLKKQVVTRLVYKKKKKNKTFIYKASTQMTKLCSFCLRQTLPMAKDKTENTCLWKKKTALFCFVFFRVPK